MTTQRQNDEMISLLATQFLRLGDPSRTILLTGNESADIPNPPTSASLTDLIGDPAELPNNSMYLVLAENTERLWIAIAVQNEWYYVGGSKAE